MLHHRICDHIARVDNVFIAGLEVYLVNEAFAGESEEAAAGDVCVTPV